MTISRFTIVSRNHTDIDEYLEQVSGWNLSLLPLAGGDVQLSSSHIESPDFSFHRFHFSIPCKLLARTDSQAVHFLIADNKVDNLIVMGNKNRKRSLFYIPTNTDFHLICPPGFTGHIYSFSPEYFKKEYQNYGHLRVRNERVRQITSFEITTQNANLLRHIFRLIQSVTEENHRSHAHLDKMIAAAFSNIVNPVFFDSLITTKPQRKETTAPSHLSYFLNSIDRHLDNPPSINTLAEECGISVRQVQKIFKQSINISPTEYIKAVRLNAVRTELKNQGNYRGIISSVANQYGFWHMGQFAKDFKALFGYLPTQILEKDESPIAEEID